MIASEREEDGEKIINRGNLTALQPHHLQGFSAIHPYPEIFPAHLLQVLCSLFKTTISIHTEESRFGGTSGQSRFQRASSRGARTFFLAETQGFVRISEHYF